MLHPAVGDHLDEEVIIQGHRIRFATVDLMGSPQAMAADFLTAVSAIAGGDTGPEMNKSTGDLPPS